MQEVRERAWLPSFQSGILLTYVDTKPVVLRFTPVARRTVAQVLAELEWMEFLAVNGVCTPRVIRSLRGNLVEEVTADDGELILVCAMNYVRGQGLGRALLDDSLVAEWGRLTGKIHRASVAYGTPATCRRPVWHSEENYDVTGVLPSASTLRSALERTVDAVRRLPVPDMSYGLIHGDLRPDNLLRLASTVAVVDFEGCIVSWFLHDIAIALFAVLPLHLPLARRTAFAGRFLSLFLDGYSKELTPDTSLLGHLDAFLKLEEMGEYLVALASGEPHRLLTGTGRASVGEWLQALQGREPLIQPLGVNLRPL